MIAVFVSDTRSSFSHDAWESAGQEVTRELAAGHVTAGSATYPFITTYFQNTGDVLFHSGKCKTSDGEVGP